LIHGGDGLIFRSHRHLYAFFLMNDAFSCVHHGYHHGVYGVYDAFCDFLISLHLLYTLQVPRHTISAVEMNLHS
jgi:hypothetical protein